MTPLDFNPLVLVVEDESDLRELLSYNLQKEGFRVQGVASGEAALEACRGGRPDLVLLDLMLPGIDGRAVCRRLKADAATRAVPVIMLTAKGEEADVVGGLELGADDYVTKPFSVAVLLSRIRAVLRRAGRAFDVSDGEAPIVLHEVAIHPGRHEVFVGDEAVELTATEFRLLCLLARRPGWVFSREQILDGLHGDAYAITGRAVDVQIVGLRKKLGPAGRYIETVRGVGYRLSEKTDD